MAVKTNSRKRYFYCRGKVILVGNGLSRAFNNSPSWDELLKTQGCELEGLPYPLKLRCSNLKKDDLIIALDGHSIPSDEYASIIRKLVDNGFVIFLTTNYTYEIEYSLLPPIKRNHEYIKSHTFSAQNDKVDNSVSVSNYTIIEYESKEIFVWHIHGEIRKKTSIVLDQNAYGKLIGKIYNYDVSSIFKVDHFGYDYFNYAYKSWVELFLLNDLYIVGYGLDYSEFDIWWILEKRKIYELKTTNKIFLYSTKKNEYNKTAKILFRNENINLIECNKSNCNDYKELYRNIIDNLIKRRK